MVRRDSLEDSDNHERWLVSYADFITLLFGFFVVMYAISSVNEGKYRVLSSSLTSAFDLAPKSLDPIQLGEPLLAASPHLIDIPDATGYRDEEEGNAQLPFAVEEAQQRLQDLADIVDVQGDQSWLELSLDANVLFTGGDARLSDGAAQVLRETAAYLAEFDNPITIEGHTDNVPSRGGRYASNWDLSAARAAAVVNFLVSQGLDRRRLAAVGYGENHPLATNATPAGRAANRRVVLVVARKLDLNAGDGRGAAFAAVRQPKPPAQPVQRRTRSGGLLFSNEAEQATPDANP